MKKNQFVSKLEEVLETSPGKLADIENLGDISEWDSLAVISLIAMVDTDYSVSISGKEILVCVTIDDLYTLVACKVNK